MDETGLALRPYVPIWVLIALAGVVLVASLLSYRRTTRPLASGARVVLLSLRLLAAFGVLLCLLRPSLETVHYEVTRRPLVLLVDASDSMTQIADTPNKLTRLGAVERLLSEHEDSLNELAEDYDIVRFRFADGILSADEEPAERTHKSAYGKALRQSFREFAGGRADALVLFGDGSHNAGSPDPVDVAAELADLGVPVYTVGVGQDVATAQLRDVKVLDLQAPPYAYLFSQFSARADILFRGCQGRQIPVRLLLDGQESQQTTVAVSHLEEQVAVVFEVTPDTTGDLKLTVVADVVPQELLETNNERSAFVKVISEGARVGFFDVLRPESKFIARALAGAPQLRVRRVFVLPGHPIDRSAIDPELYDVLILGDLPSSALPASRVLELKKAVQNAGKGLVALIGPLSGSREGWAHSELSDVLPVRIANTVQTIEGERFARLTALAADHPVVALGETPELTRQVWQSLPPLAGAVGGVETKRGARVLVADQDGNPLIVTHRSGAGHVASVMADTTFRWFFTTADTQEEHRRIWRQLCLWASGMQDEPEMRLRVELSRDRLLVGEQLQVTVQLADAEGSSLRDAVVTASVDDPEGGTESLSFAFSREVEGFIATYLPALHGDHLVSVTVRRGGELIGQDERRFHASSINPELEDPVADMRLLRRVSAMTRDVGGRYYHYLQAGELFPALARRGGPLKLVTRQRREIWDHWLTFALIAGCLVAEWVLRRLKGLI